MDFITLKNKDQKKLIQGLVLFPLKINKDPSGTLVETLRTDWSEIYGEGREFEMQFYTVTDSGVSRDEKMWHIHPNIQEDRIYVAKGEIVLAVADKRKDSPTKELLNLFHMKADEDPYLVLLPKNVLHTFMVVSSEEGILLNYPTHLYNPDNLSEDGRVSFEEAKIKLSDGNSFSWNLVRKEFSLPPS